jgi:hypothetical protein
LLHHTPKTTRLWKWEANITFSSRCDNGDTVTGEKQMQPFMEMNGSGTPSVSPLRVEPPRYSSGVRLAELNTAGEERRRISASPKRRHPHKYLSRPVCLANVLIRSDNLLCIRMRENPASWESAQFLHSS